MGGGWTEEKRLDESDLERGSCLSGAIRNALGVSGMVTGGLKDATFVLAMSVCRHNGDGMLCNKPQWRPFYSTTNATVSQSQRHFTLANSACISARLQNAIATNSLYQAGQPSYIGCCALSWARRRPHRPRIYTLRLPSGQDMFVWSI